MEKIIDAIASANGAVNNAVWGLPGLILTFNGLMMIPNLIGVLALMPLVLKITANYVDRKVKGKKVAPILSYDPQIQKEMEAALEDREQV